MFKQLALTVLILINLGYSTFAQKIDFGSRKIDVEYTEIPAQSNLFSHATYSVDFITSGTTLTQLRLKEGNINTMLNLDGYGYLKEDGDFTYIIKLGKAKMIKEYIKTRKDQVTSGDGSQISNTYYTAVSVLSIPTVLMIYDNILDQVIYEKEFSTVDKPTIFKSPEKDKKRDAQIFIDYKERELNVNARNK